MASLAFSFRYWPYTFSLILKEQPQFEWAHPQATSKGTDFLKAFIQDFSAHWVLHAKTLPVLFERISTDDNYVAFLPDPYIPYNKSSPISSSFFKNLRFKWGWHPAQLGKTHYK